MEWSENFVNLENSGNLRYGQRNFSRRHIFRDLLIDELVYLHVICTLN